MQYCIVGNFRAHLRLKNYEFGKIKHLYIFMAYNLDKSNKGDD